ncbi:hypothetical protein [Pseudanabaena yagii]|uniref:Uncharacterized protein n=1 Tax=Pseudanabaena yagii GIHE-NHR1 TaxID=2722753 RepID=A0ABX1LKW7_9CYAN|nr:hypothetical protein [Pseudanabaena yagii]NMF56750.1 hypothetical protein [Pseudanabaena yagii GIHE-NHR1]
MKKSSLALVSSPALLATFLASGTPALANTSISSSTNKDPDTYTESVVITKTTTESNNQSLSDRNDRSDGLTSDRIGDLAVQKFGCDCMGCRQATLSLLSK